MSSTGDEQIYEAVIVKDPLSSRPPIRPYVLGVAVLAVIGVLAVAVLLVLSPPRIGISFVGGTRLIFELSHEDAPRLAEDDPTAKTNRQGESRINMKALVQALTRRINPRRVKEVVIRPHGEMQIEIIIPEVEVTEIERIKDIIVKQGYLKFRIVADRTRNKRVCQLGEAALASKDKKVRNATFVMDPQGQRVGEWVRLGVEETADAGGPRIFKVVDTADMLKRELVPGEVEVLMVVGDARSNLDDGHLRSVGKSIGRDGGPVISFTMTSEGAGLMGHLTSNNLPDRQTGSHAKLGIVMDGELLSAPRINSTIQKNGIIEGRFTDKEVDSWVSVLHAGRLPAGLKKGPVLEESFPPDPSAPRHLRTIVFTGSGFFLLAWLVMSFRYGWLGSAACVAGGVQFVLTLALLSLINGTFTLSLIATLVLLAIVVIACNAATCEFIRRKRQTIVTERGSVRVSALVAVALVGAFYCLILPTAAVAYALGGFEIVTVAAGLFCGGISALIVHFCLWLCPEV